MTKKTKKAAKTVYLMCERCESCFPVPAGTTTTPPHRCVDA